MTVTMALIARRAKLSQATVSRVLSGKGLGFISEATRKRVLAVATELGYVAVRSDSAQSTKRKGVVALWIRNANAPFYARIIKHLQRLAVADGSDLVLSVSNEGDGDPESISVASTFIRPAAWAKVDGIIVVDCLHRLDAYLQRARGQAVPVVAAGSTAVPRIDSVAFDLFSGAEQAVRHLVKCGRKHIAHLTGGCTIPSVSLARSETYARVVVEHGQTPLILSATDVSRTAARQAVAAAFASSPACDALFCMNDDLAIGAYRGLLDVDVRVPHDVAIVGYDSIDDTEFLEVPITSVRQDAEQLCLRAWELLWRRIHEPGSETVTETLMPELVVRASCGSSPNGRIS